MVDRARDLALDVLQRVETRGAFASAALRAAFDQDNQLEDKDRAFATELVYGVLRRRAQCDRVISALGKRLKDLDPRLHDVLRLAAYQLVFLERVPDHAAVSIAVDQAKKRRGPRGGGLVNALLRKLTGKPKAERLPPPPPFATDPVGHLAEGSSLPRTLAERLIDDLGADRALSFAQASLERAPLVLRANLLRTTRDALLSEVHGTAGAHAKAVHLPEQVGLLPADLLAVAEGRATPQDEGSMLVIDLFDPQPGERILDVCAAPGGKSTDIAERMRDEGHVIACDLSTEKLARIRETVKRLGLKAVETHDVLPSETTQFDRVLVDAPCTGLGTLRRHPELRWRYRKEDAQRLITIQREVLNAGFTRLKPGGVLVYSVCTVTRAEGTDALEALGDPSRYTVEGTLETSPDQPGSPDGFHAIRIRKKVSA